VFTPVGARLPKGAATLARQTSSARGLARRGRTRRRLGELVLQAFGVRAAVGLELGLDPVQRLAVALRALAAVTELGEALDGGLVPLQVELADKARHRVGGLTGRRLRKCRGAGQRSEGKHLTRSGDSTSFLLGHF